MTKQRRQAMLTVIAGKVALAKADRRLKELAPPGMSPNTVARVLQGKNYRISSLLEIADALGYEIDITLTPRNI